MPQYSSWYVPMCSNGRWILKWQKEKKYVKRKELERVEEERDQICWFKDTMDYWSSIILWFNHMDNMSSQWW